MICHHVLSSYNFNKDTKHMNKLALYNFLGRPVSFYQVTTDSVSGVTESAKQIGHFIFIADASGSMYGDMPALRSMVEKLLTLQEYKDEAMFASLLSFASNGDLVTHFSHVRVGDIMAPGSSYVENIRKMGTRGLTCISQGLEAVPALVQPGELTACVLLSDGFANDRSPGAERRQIDLLVEKLRVIPNLFVNTIAFRDWADFKLLSFIANACSGTCFQAPSVKEVFDTLHGTTKVLTGSTQPALTVPIGDADYQIFTSKYANKTIGGSSDFVVRGLRATDSGLIYRLKAITEAEYNALNVPVDVSLTLPLALARLAEGDINGAKYAMITSRIKGLIRTHAAALVNEQLAAMAADIEKVYYNDYTVEFTREYGVPNANIPSVVDVLSTLGDHAQDVDVDGDFLRSHYKARGVRRVPGTRNDDGTIAAPWVKVAHRGGNWLRVRSFDMSRNTATINMLTDHDVDLVRTDDNTVISKVAGVDLNLKGYANYTLVGDGTVNVDTLRVRIKSKALHRKLVDLGVVSGTYEPSMVAEISLKDRPLISYATSFDPSTLDGVFHRLARARVLASILNASIKGESSSLTADQLAELKRHFITPSMNVSLPTTTEYRDLAEALANGTVDTRVSYNIDLGSVKLGMLNLADLYSANEFLARHYTVSTGGVEEKKPTFTSFLDRPVYGRKTLSSRTVINDVDNLMKPIFDDVLNLAPNGSIRDILTDLGIDGVDDVYNALWGAVDRDTAVDTLLRLRRQVDSKLETLFHDVVSPLVFFIGATGLIPDTFGCRAMTADQIRQTAPNLSLGKTNEDATFYLVGDTVLTVKATNEYFSTGHAAAA